MASTLVGTIAVQGVTFVGGTLLFFHLVDRWDLLRVHRPTRRDLALVLLGFALLVGAFFGFDFLYSALGIDTAESSIVTSGRENPALFLYLIPLSVLVVAPGEELLYRGLVQGWLRQSFGPAVAIGVASVLFATIHVWGYAGTPLPSLVATLAIVAFLAVFLGALYEYSGNLLVPVLVHGLYNALQFLLAYWQATGVF
nr:CPBP family intramembrane glutamic endopeptidase [Halomarina salina]